MFNLNNEIDITVSNIPVSWIPKIELYYPDLPQFPIMYIHALLNDTRIIGCPVAASYDINSNLCNATFRVLCNVEASDIVINLLKDEISNRIGSSDPITKDTIINCCKGNHSYINLFDDLWNYIEESYGCSIPFGQYYEEVFSISRFVAAWTPKTGRQSEMRMLYNFMSCFGEEVIFPVAWKHLEYYVLPLYEDIKRKDFTLFPKYHKLYHAMESLFINEFTSEYSHEGIIFHVLPKAWPPNKEDFISEISSKLNSEDKYYAELLVDAFNRHPWRASFYVSAILGIHQSDYKTWSKEFFINFYNNGGNFKGYSEKVIACFLQQGFENTEVIPIDTWIETFYNYPLGINERSQFFQSFNNLGKLERIIWMASQANKTNMKNFFDILWCQRYGVNGNNALRGTNPLACSQCSLNGTCIGLSHIKNQKIYLSTDVESDCPSTSNPDFSFLCILENSIPKKIYIKKRIRDKELRKMITSWVLIDEFSGYLLDDTQQISQNYIQAKSITVDQFINSLTVLKKQLI